MMRGFHQELAHFAVHAREGSVLWCDGDHGMNPYDFAELNLERGHDADWGADRLLVKRCMTPFQWDTVLTKHVAEKLLSTPTSMVLAAPYDSQFSTDELKDWEQEDYVAYSLKHLRGLAQTHKVPIVLSVDMVRWWRSHPTLARMTYEAVDARWSVQRSGEGWRAVRDREGLTIEALSTRQHTIWDYATPEAMPKPPAIEVQASLEPAAATRPWWRRSIPADDGRWRHAAPKG
jgi:hypothetical protein